MNKPSKVPGYKNLHIKAIVFSLTFLSLCVHVTGVRRKQVSSSVTAYSSGNRVSSLKRVGTCVLSPRLEASKPCDPPVLVPLEAGVTWVLGSKIIRLKEYI